MADSHGSINGILLLYAHPYRADAPTIMEHVRSFSKYSRFKVWAINVEMGFPDGLRALHFKVVVLHYSLFGAYPFRLNPAFTQYLQQSHGAYKVAFFQDEYQNCQPRFDFINAIGIDCIYTLLEPEWFPKVYPAYTDVTRVHQTLSGYVDDDLVERARKIARPLEDRACDVGYRARKLPFHMGKGAQEKSFIAEEFLARTETNGLRLDIKTDEADRIYGDAWHAFIANCRAMLGVESGVSIFDIDGRIRPEVDRLLRDDPDIAFATVYEKVLKHHEDAIYYRMLSPRVFECAALKVVLILFEGRYTGIIEPGVHYIPLKKDFSNIDEVISTLQDTARVERIAQRAYNDLIESDRYRYRRFIAEFDANLEGIAAPHALADSEIKRTDRCLQAGYHGRLLRFRVKHFIKNNSIPVRRTLRTGVRYIAQKLSI